MKKVINCLKEDNPFIHKKCKEVTVEEGFEIAKILFEILNKRQDGIGLAANQVGIDAAVAVVNVREPLILINPKIVEQWDKIPYYEGCLSYKNKGVNTERYKNVTISTEQEECNWYFSGAPNPTDGQSGWEKQERNKNDAEMRLLETVCIQHEIDHLNGIVCMDRKVDTTIQVEKKIGRNQKVLIACGPDSKVVKYKKAIPLLERGWVLVESE